MVQTLSTMTALGSSAPDFNLPDTAGTTIGRADFANSPLLVVFLCNHCPFVKHLADPLATLAREYKEKGVGIVAINSNDVEKYPDDGPAMMAREAETRGYTFHYLLDASQETAKAYKAACTPDFFLYDADHRLVYRGQFDDARPGNDEPVTGDDLRAALDAVLAGQPAPADQKPSIGCNIKWKPGNEPGYLTD